MFESTCPHCGDVTHVKPADYALNAMCISCRRWYKTPGTSPPISAIELKLIRQSLTILLRLVIAMGVLHLIGTLTLVNH